MSAVASDRPTALAARAGYEAMGQGAQSTERRAGGSRFRRAVLIAAASLVLGASQAASAATPPSSPDAGTWITDGPVYALAHANGTTYIGGDFAHVGRRVGAGTAFATTGADAGSAAAGFAEVGGGVVNAVASDGDGGWYIGGDFTSAGGVAVTGLAHIDPGGTLDAAFTPQLSCQAGSDTCTTPNVDALVYSTGGPDAGTLYVGGEFDKVGMSARANLAALDAGGSVLAWNPGAEGAVHALAETQLDLDTTVPLVMVGGEFTSVAGRSDNATLAPVWGVGAVDQNGDSVAGTAPGSWVATHTATVRALAIGPQSAATGNPPAVSLAVYVGQDGDEGLVAYPFAIPASGSRSFRLVFSPVSNWTPHVGCPAGSTPLSGDPCGVRALLLDESALYVGGSFTAAGQTTEVRRGAAALAPVSDPAGSGNAATALAWNPDADGTVAGLARTAAGVVLAGDFTRLGTSAAEGLAQVTAAADAGAPAPLWQAQLAGGGARAVAAGPGDAVYAGGDFNAAGAVERDGLAAIGANGAPTVWAPRADGPVHALALDGGVLFVGGGFTHLSSDARAYLGALDATTGDVLPWQADADGWVLALDTAGSTVYAGGAFSAIAGKPRAHAAAVAGVGASGGVLPWAPAADDSVRALAASCGLVYLGGSFTSVHGDERDRIAAVNSVDGAPTAWAPDANSVVYALARAGDVVYAGGAFTLIGGENRPGIAALGGDDGLATAWNPYAADPSIVRALALSADAQTIYAGGSFRTLGGVARARAAAIDSTTGAPLSWAPAFDAPVYALAASGDNLYAGGSFRVTGSVAQQGFATFSGGSDAADLAGLPCSGEKAVPTSGSEPEVPAPGSPPAPGDASAVLGVKVTDTQAPSVSTFSTRPRRFRVVAAKRRGARTARWRRVRAGTTFRFSTSEGGRAEIAFARRVPGLRAGRRCVRRREARRHKRAARRCARMVSAGALRFDVAAGPVHKRFGGRVGRRALAPGRYVATLTVIDATGNRSEPRRSRFEVVL
jgi:hypothetical protein